MFTSLGDLVKRGKEMYAREEMMRQISQLMEDAEHVCIMRPQLRQIAEEMRGALETDEGSFLHDPKRYPYESPAKNDEETIQFFYILGSQNFCIWRRDRKGDVEAWDIHINGQRFVGARGVTAANMRALRIGKNLLDPACLSQLTLKDVEDIYRDEETGQVNLQLLPERQAKFNEIGSVLQEHFNGSFTTLLQRAEGYLFREDGQGIVQQLLTYFPLSYGDWPFCKLAMLTPALLYHRRDKGIPTTEEYLSLTNINDFDNFEIPADYYIPFFFIRVGVFAVSDALESHLRERKLIERDSRMEKEYRAFTMVAGRELAKLTGRRVTEVDTECWKAGYLRCRLCQPGISDEELPCPYRRICKGFNEEKGLMDLRWPLVMTTCY